MVQAYFLLGIESIDTSFHECSPDLGTYNNDTSDLFNKVIVENKDEWLKVKLGFPVTEGDYMDRAKNLHQRLLFHHWCLSYSWNEGEGLEEMRKQPVPYKIRQFIHMLHKEEHII
jgi:hypothetical protein